MSDFKTLPEGFTGIWIPAELYLHKSLNGSDRELLGSICSFHKSGSKYTSITYLADLLGVDKSSIRKRVAKLEESGFLVRDNRNLKTGGSNLISPTPKCFGFEVEAAAPVVVKKPVKASKNKVSKGGQAKSPAHSKTPMGQAKSPTRQAKSPTDNKLNNKTDNKVSESSADAGKNFVDQVMTELLADNLPPNEKRYAGLKIREYQDRFPESQSVADCWSYVVQAVNHKAGLTGQH